MIGNRPSSLPIAQFCARAPQLGVGAGRAAAKSSVWHARAAGKEWQAAYDRLTPDEQADIDGWKMPRDVEVCGVTLRYDDALKEVPVGLGEYASWAEPSDPNALSAGTNDFHWLEQRILFVGDLKKSQWTEPDGPRSLQIWSYAIALAAKYAEHVDLIVTGVWHAEEGTWEWGEPVAVDSDECTQMWLRVRAAILHTDGDYSTGPHCRRCYSRTKCPAYLVPPGEANAGLVRYLSGQLDNGSALELRVMLERVKETVKACDEALKSYADEHGGVVDEAAGKVWRAVPCATAPSLDRKALERDHPELVQGYMRPGGTKIQHQWRNLPKEKRL